MQIPRQQMYIRAHSLTASFCRRKNIAFVLFHGHPRPKMYIRVHFWAASLQANLLLFRTTAVEQCTSVYTVQRRVCAANSLLYGITDIHVRSDTLRISAAARMPSFRNEHPCSFLSFKFFITKNSILFRTTDILSEKRCSGETETRR